MEFFIWSFLSGVVGGGVSMGFRYYEIKNRSIYFWNQMICQVLLFFAFFWIFSKIFVAYEMKLPYGTHLSWFWIFFIVSNAAYYIVKIVFEFSTGIAFFPTDREIEQFIKDNDLDKDF